MDRENDPIDDTGIQANEPAPSPERADAIQLEKPVPPWERPGYFRLDCEPHRGTSLICLAIANLVTGALTCCPVPYLAAIALPLAGTTWYLASSDLKKMERGLMDPRGGLQTDNARLLSRMGLILSALGIAVWALVLLFSWLDLT